jgi:hypothetical protein
MLIVVPERIRTGFSLQPIRSNYRYVTSHRNSLMSLILMAPMERLIVTHWDLVKQACRYI